MARVLSKRAVEDRIADAVSSIVLPRHQERINQQEFLFRNDSDETIPPYGCMRIVDGVLDDGRYMVTVDKPDQTGGPFIFNGVREVPSGERGQYQPAGFVRALFTSGTPAANEIWGPITTWEIESFGSAAITVAGEIDTDLILGQNPVVVTQISVQAPSGGIPARSGNQYGSAVCEVMTTNASGEVVTTGNTVTVYNQIKAAIMTNEDRLGKANAEIDFKWHGIVDDCNTEET